jgi:hypothetical protein
VVGLGQVQELLVLNTLLLGPAGQQ